MRDLFKKAIQEASSIVIIVGKSSDIDALGSASALYTYMLQLHKKVVLVSQKSSFEKHLYVIPWIEKIKTVLPKKVDLVFTCNCCSLEMCGFEDKEKVITFDHREKSEKYGKINIIDPCAISTTQVIFELFLDLHVKINPKMATALYAGFVEKSNGFLSIKVDGIIFALTKKLIELGANHKDVVKYLQKYSTLSQVRLLGKMLTEMELLCDAQIACFSVSQEMLLGSGASVDDCKLAMQKALELPTVRFSVAVVETENLFIKGFIISDEEEKDQYLSFEFKNLFSLQMAKEKILIKVREIEKEKSK